MSREGSVRRSASGNWHFVVDTTPPGAAKRVQLRRRGFRTKREALDALDEIKGTLRTGTFVAPSRQSFSAYLEEWLLTIVPTVRPATLYSYTRNVRVPRDTTHR